MLKEWVLIIALSGVGADIEKIEGFKTVERCLKASEVINKARGMYLNAICIRKY